MQFVKEVRAYLVEKVKEEFEAILHPQKSSSHHHRETHGMNSE